MDVHIARGGLLLIAIGAASIAGCSTSVRSTDGGPGSFATAMSEPTPANCGTADLSLDRGPYLIAGFSIPGYGAPDMGFSDWDMALHSTVVAARVVSQEPGVFTLRSTLSVYTPYEIEIEQVLQGWATTGLAVATVGGGTAGCYTLTVDIAPHLQAGQRYVMFVGDPALGSDIGEVWEAWPIENGDTVDTPGGPMSLADLAARIERLWAVASPTP